MQRKLGAIWARVSTPGQTEQSLDSQVERCKARLEAAGYVVPADRILGVDWSSIDLLSCPEYQRLQGWVHRKEIGALAILDRDRLNLPPLQRLLFMAECKEAGVSLEICQGPPIVDEPEGMILELAQAIYKLRQVERAQQGARDGLFDRLRLKRKPSVRHKVRGYDWDGERRLVPNTDHWQIEYALRKALEGVPTRRIQYGLRELGVDVAHKVIHEWLKNPIYAGRYYGHRAEAVVPVSRRGDTSGKSSTRRRPQEEWYYLPEVEVVNPPLTWDEYLVIQERLQRNKLDSKRNAKRFYMMRGRIICDFHQRRYVGRVSDNIYRYWCPVGKCARPTLNGPNFDAEIKLYCKLILTEPEVVDGELSKHRRGRWSMEGKLTRELKGMERKITRTLNEEMELERRSLRGKIAPEIYHRLKASLRGERRWYQDRIEEIQSGIETLQHKTKALATLREIAARLGRKLDTAMDEEWWEILAALSLTAHVRENGAIEIEAGIPLTDVVSPFPRAGWRAVSVPAPGRP